VGLSPAIAIRSRTSPPSERRSTCPRKS